MPERVDGAPAGATGCIYQTDFLKLVGLDGMNTGGPAARELYSATGFCWNDNLQARKETKEHR
jgi:hypothetical protein